MSRAGAGLAMILILLWSLASAVYEAVHQPHGNPGVEMSGPHGTALPNI